MREEFTSGGRDDFMQRYVGTYGWYSAEKKKVLVYLEAVEGDQLKFRDTENTPYRANADNGVFFDFLPLNKGVYNRENDDVVLIRRKPQRQWHRGISTGNTAVVSLRRTFWTPTNPDEKVPPPVNLGFKVLQEIFGDHKDDALQKFLAGERKSVALDHKFAIVDGHLTIYDLHIGSLKDKEIQLAHDLFLQEVKDLVKEKKLPFVVTV